MTEKLSPDIPCACTYNLINDCKAKGIILPGLALVVTKSDQQVVGLHSLHAPKLTGAEPHSAVLAFRFCPWCGRELARVRTRTGEIAGELTE